jgi:hypothetical protein
MLSASSAASFAYVAIGWLAQFWSYMGAPYYKARCALSLAFFFGMQLDII